MRAISATCRLTLMPSILQLQLLATPHPPPSALHQPLSQHPANPPPRPPNKLHYRQLRIRHEGLQLQGLPLPHPDLPLHPRHLLPKYLSQGQQRPRLLINQSPVPLLLHHLSPSHKPHQNLPLPCSQGRILHNLGPLQPPLVSSASSPPLLHLHSSNQHQHQDNL